MTSPVRALAAGLLAGSVAGLSGLASGVLVAVAAALGVAASVAARRRPRTAWTIAAATAAFLVGVLRGGAVDSSPPAAEPQELACVTGTVTRAADFDEAPPSADDPGDREAVFRVAADEPSVHLDVHVRLREGDEVPAFLPGDRVRLVGSAAPVRRPTNPGAPDRRAELARAGVRGAFDVRSAGAAADLGPADLDLPTRIRRAGETSRRALLARLRDACGGPGPVPALLGCLLLGDRSGLDEATATAFRDSGTAHLLSVSGLHVVLLAAAARALARRVVPRRARRRFGLPSLVALLVVYCALCRFATPVVRAAVFLAVAETARACGRRPSPLDSLAAAAALVVAVDPAQVLDASFQLSFAAVLGLALYTRGLRTALFPSLALYRRFPGAIPPRRLRLYDRLATALATSLAASAATAPVVAAVFARLQPGAPLSNLVAVPIAAVLVPLAAALAIVGGVASWLTAPLAALAAAPLRTSVGLAAAIPGATIETGRPCAALVVLSVAALVAAAATIGRRPRTGAALLAAAWLAVAAAPLCRTDDRAPEIVVLDVGHGLCVLARSGDGSDVLFDAGGHVPGVGRRTIVPALRAMGVRRLGAVFLSHQDADHCGALPDLLDALTVGEVVVSPGFGADRLPAALVATCRARGVPVVVVARGDVWRRRGVEVSVLSPCGDVPPPTDNEASIVAHVTVGDGDARVTALVPGDVDGRPLHALGRDATAPPARVLVLPHHGRCDRAEQLALVARLRSTVLVASTSPSAPMTMPEALVTGRDGAIRVRAGEAPAAFPWPGP